MLQKVLACASLLFAEVSMAQDTTLKPVSFDALPGWEEDDHAAAFETFLVTCDVPKDRSALPDDIWLPICNFAKSKPNPKSFFELMFQPVIVDPSATAKFTGYFEPTLKGSRNRGGPFQTPIYKKPSELTEGQLWKSREEIASGALEGRGLEIAWLKDPVEAFFMQVQGSGRIELEDGNTIRVGYAAKNGHEYSSIGLELIRRGTLSKNSVSAANIAAWVRKNPAAGKELLNHNESYVFFRELNLHPEKGPLGAMHRPVSTERTIAVDPKYNPLGLPVYISKDGPDPMERLMIAQDVGSAIKGPQRADIFYGTGAEAGKIAGRIKSSGSMFLLLPHEIFNQSKLAQSDGG